MSELPVEAAEELSHRTDTVPVDKTLHQPFPVFLPPKLKLLLKSADCFFWWIYIAASKFISEENQRFAAEVADKCLFLIQLQAKNPGKTLNEFQCGPYLFRSGARTSRSSAYR